MMQSSQVRNADLVLMPNPGLNNDTEKGVPLWMRDQEKFLLDWFNLDRTNICQCTKEYTRQLTKWRKCKNMSTARILRGLLKRIMMFLQTHMSYVDQKILIDCELEEELIILMSMFMDMEMKVWLKQREEIPDAHDQYEHRITDRILHWFYTLLAAHTQRIDTLLSLQTVYSRNSKSIFDPIFRKVLSEMPNGPLSDVAYVRYMLIFKLWHERVLVAEDDSSIVLRDRIIANLIPAHSYINFSPLLKSCLRQTPRNESNVAKYHMMPNNINLRKSCEDFLNKCRVPLDEINFASISLVDDELDDMLGDENNGVKELMRMIDNRNTTVSSSISVTTEASNIECIDLTILDGEPSTSSESVTLSAPEPLVPAVIIDLTNDVDEPCPKSRKRPPNLDKSTSRTSSNARRIFRKEEEVYMASNLMNFIFMCPLKHQDELNRSQFDQKLCSLCKDPIHEHTNCGSFQFATSKDSRLNPGSAKRELFNQAQTSSERLQCNSDANLTVCDKNDDRTSSVTQQLPNAQPNVARIPKQSNVALPCDRPEQVKKPKQQVYPLMKETTSLDTYSRRFSEKLDKRKLAELQKQTQESDSQVDASSLKTTRLDDDADYSAIQTKNTTSKQRSVELQSFTDKPNLPQSGRISPSTSLTQNEFVPDIPSIIVASSSDRTSCSKTTRSQTDIQQEDAAAFKPNFSPKTIRKVILPVPRSREFDNPTRQRLRISPEPRKDGMLRFASPKELPTTQPLLICNSEAVKSDILPDTILNKDLNDKTIFENKVILSNKQISETPATEQNLVSEIKTTQKCNEPNVPVVINTFKTSTIHGIISTEIEAVPAELNERVTQNSEQVIHVVEMNTKLAVSAPEAFEENISVFENSFDALTDEMIISEIMQKLVTEVETNVDQINSIQSIEIKLTATLNETDISETDDMVCLAIIQMIISEIESIQDEPVPDNTPDVTSVELDISENNCEQDIVVPEPTSLMDDTTCSDIIEMIISEIESVPSESESTPTTSTVERNIPKVELISEYDYEQNISLSETVANEIETISENTPECSAEIETVSENTPEYSVEIETVSENTPECSAEIETVSENTPECSAEIETAFENTPECLAEIETVSEITPECAAEIETVSENIPECAAEIETVSENTPECSAEIEIAAENIPECSAEIETVSENTPEYSAEIETVSENIPECAAEIETVSENIPECSAEIETVSENTLEYSAEIETVSENIPECAAEIETTSENTPECSAEIETVSENTPECSAEFETVSENTPECSAEIATVSENTPECLAEIEIASENTPECSAEIETVSENTPECSAEIETVSENIPECASEIETVSENTPECSAEIETVSENIPKCSAEIETVSENTPECSAEIETVSENTPVCSTEIETVSENTPESTAEFETVSENTPECSAEIETASENTPECSAEIEINEPDLFLETEILINNQEKLEQSPVTEIVHDEVLITGKNKTSETCIEESQFENFVSETNNKQSSQILTNVEQITINAIKYTENTIPASETEPVVAISENAIENNMSELTESENQIVSLTNSGVSDFEIEIHTEEFLVPESEVAVEVSVETEEFDETNLGHSMLVPEGVISSENQVIVSSHEICNTIVQNTENIQIKKGNRPKFSIYSKRLGRSSLAKRNPGGFPKTRTKVKQDQAEAEEIEKSRLELPETEENEPIITNIDASTPKKRGRRRKTALPVETAFTVESAATDSTVPRRGRRKKLEEKSVEESPKLESSPSGTSRRKKAQPVHISQIKIQSELISSVTHEQNDILTSDTSKLDSTSEIVELVAESKRRKRKQIFELIPDLPTKTNKLVEIENDGADLEPKLKDQRTLRVICEKLSDTDLMGRTNSNRLLRLNRPPLLENPKSDIDNIEAKVSIDTPNSKRLLRTNKPPILETQTSKKVDEHTKESSTSLEDNLPIEHTTKPMDSKRKRGRPPKSKDKASSNSDGTPVDYPNDGLLNANSEKQPKSIERASSADKQKNSLDLIIEFVATNQCFESPEDDVPLTMRKTIKPLKKNKRLKSVDVCKNKKQTSKTKVLKPAEIIAINSTSTNTKQRGSLENSSKDSEEISDTILTDELDKNTSKSDLIETVLNVTTSSEYCKKYHHQLPLPEKRDFVDELVQIPKKTVTFDLTPKICFIPRIKSKREAAKNIKVKIGNKQINLKLNTSKYQQIKQSQITSVQKLQTPLAAEQDESDSENAQNLEISNTQMIQNDSSDCATIQITDDITPNEESIEQSTIVDDCQIIEDDSSENIFSEQMIVDDSFVIQESIEISSESTIDDYPVVSEETADIENEEEINTRESIETANVITSEIEGELKIDAPENTESMKIEDLQVISEETITIIDSEVEISSQESEVETILNTSDELSIVENVTEEIITIDDSQIIPDDTVTIIENEIEINSQEQQEINLTTDELLSPNFLPTEEISTDDSLIIPEDAVTEIENEININSQERQEIILTTDESPIIPEDAITIIEDEINTNSQNVQPIAEHLKISTLEQNLETSQIILDESVESIEDDIMSQNSELDTISTVEESIDVLLNVEKMDIEEISTEDVFQISPEETVVTKEEVALETITIMKEDDQINEEHRMSTPENITTDNYQIIAEDTKSIIEVILKAEELESTTAELNAEELSIHKEEVLTTDHFQIMPEETIVITKNEVELNSQESTTGELGPTNVFLKTEDITHMDEEIVSAELQVVSINSDSIKQTDNIIIESNPTIIEIKPEEIETISVQSQEIHVSEIAAKIEEPVKITNADSDEINIEPKTEESCTIPVFVSPEIVETNINTIKTNDDSTQMIVESIDKHENEQLYVDAVLSIPADIKDSITLKQDLTDDVIIIDDESNDEVEYQHLIPVDDEIKSKKNEPETNPLRQELKQMIADYKSKHTKEEACIIIEDDIESKHSVSIEDDINSDKLVKCAQTNRIECINNSESDRITTSEVIVKPELFLDESITDSRNEKRKKIDKNKTKYANRKKSEKKPLNINRGKFNRKSNIRKLSVVLKNSELHVESSEVTATEERNLNIDTGPQSKTETFKVEKLKTLAEIFIRQLQIAHLKTEKSILLDKLIDESPSSEKKTVAQEIASESAEKPLNTDIIPPKSVSTMIEELFKVISDSDSSTVNTKIDSNLVTSISDETKATNTDTDPQIKSSLKTSESENVKEDSIVEKVKINGSKQIPKGNFDFDIILKTFEINKNVNEKKSNDTKNKNEILNKTYYNSSESDLDDSSNSGLVIDTSFESSDSENKNTDTQVQNTKLYKRYIAKASARKELAIKKSYLKKGKAKSNKAKMELIAKQIKKMQRTAQINEEIVFEEMYVALKANKIKRNIANQIVLPAEAMQFTAPEVLENCIMTNSESIHTESKHAKEGIVKCSVNGIEKVNKKVLVRNDGMIQYLQTLPEHTTNDLIVVETPHCNAISTKSIAECELCASASSAKVETCPSPRLVASYYGDNIPTDENYRLNILAGVAFNLEPLDTSTEVPEVQRTRTNNICTQHRIKPGDLCMLVAFPDSIPESSVPSVDFNIIDNHNNSEQFKVQKLGSVPKPKGIELENKIQALTEQAKGAKANAFNQKTGSANDRERLNDLLSTLEAMIDGENSNKTTQQSLGLTEATIPMTIPNTADLHLSPDDDDFTLPKTIQPSPLQINSKPTKLYPLENSATKDVHSKIVSAKETKIEPKQDCPIKPNSASSKSKSKLKSPNKSEASFLLSKYKIFTDNKQCESNPNIATRTTSPPSYIRSTRPMRMVTNGKRKTSADNQAPPRKKLNTEEVFDKLLEEHKKESNTLRPSPISTENSLPIQNAMPTLDDKEPEPIVQEIIPLPVTQHANPLIIPTVVENHVKQSVEPGKTITPVAPKTVKKLVHMPEKVPCVELILKEATQNMQIDTLIEETEIFESVLKSEPIEVETKIELPKEIANVTIVDVNEHYRIIRTVPDDQEFETKITSGSDYFVTPEVEDYLEVLSKQLSSKDSTFEDMPETCPKTEPLIIETIVDENLQDRNAVVEEWFNKPDVEISYNQTIEECNLFEDISNSSNISQPTTSGANKCEGKFYNAKYQTPDSGIVLDEDSIHQEKHYSEADTLTDAETQPETVNYFKNLINPIPHAIQITDLSVVQPVNGSSVKCSIPLERIMTMIPFLIKQIPETENKISNKRKAIALENFQNKMRKLSPVEETIEETVQVKKRKLSEVETNPEVADTEWSTEEVMSPATSTGISTPLRTKGSVKEYPECLYRITESPVPSGSCCINSPYTPYTSDISLQEEPTFYVEGGIDLCSDFQNQYCDRFDNLKEQQPIQASSDSPDDNRNVQQSLQTCYYFVDSQFALPEYMNDENLRSLIVENNMTIDKGMVAFNMHQIQPETKPHLEEAKRACETDSQITGIVDEICRNMNNETSEYQADTDLLDVEMNTDHGIKVDETVSEVHVEVTPDTYQELDSSRGPVIEEVPIETETIQTVYTSALVKTITTQSIPTNQPLTLNSAKSDSKVIVERIDFSPTHTIVNKDLTLTTDGIADDVLKKETENNAEAIIPKPVTSFSYIRAKNKDRKSNAKHENDTCSLNPTDSKNNRQKSAHKSSPKPSSYASSPKLIQKNSIETTEKEFKINPDLKTQTQKSFGQKSVLNASPKPLNDVPKSVNVKPIESKSLTNADAKIPIQRSYGQKMNEEKPPRRNIDYEFDQLLASGNQKQSEIPSSSYKYKYSTDQLPNRQYAESKIQVKTLYLQKLDSRPIRRNTDYEFDQLLASEKRQKCEDPKPRIEYSSSSELFESKHLPDRRPSKPGPAHMKPHEHESRRYAPRIVGNSRSSPSTRRNVPGSQIQYGSVRSEPMYHLQKIDHHKNATGHQNPPEPPKKNIEEKLWLSDQKLTELVKQAHIYYSKKC